MTIRRFPILSILQSCPNQAPVSATILHLKDQTVSPYPHKHAPRSRRILAATPPAASRPVPARPGHSRPQRKARAAHHRQGKLGTGGGVGACEGRMFSLLFGGPSWAEPYTPLCRGTLAAMWMNTDPSRRIAALVATSESILSHRFDHDVHLTLRDTLTTRKSLVLRCAITPPASYLPSAQALVFGTDTRQAEAALLEHIALIGRLHASTIGKYAEYAAIRTSLKPPATSADLFADPWPVARQSPVTTAELDRRIEAYRVLCAQLGIRLPIAVGDQISLVAQCVEVTPTPWLALCQGDQNGPGGTLRLDGHLRLYDFDCGQFRHALLEGVPGQSTWGCLMRIPPAIVRQMEQVYRSVLAASHPQVQDDRCFREAMVAAHARWHLFQILHRLLGCLIEDAPRGPTTRRQQFLAWLDNFVALTEAASSLLALGTVARALAGRLRQQWPQEVDVLPYYPAFQRQVS